MRKIKKEKKETITTDSIIKHLGKLGVGTISKEHLEQIEKYMDTDKPSGAKEEDE